MQKFVVDGNAFQTFITLSTKNFCLMRAVRLGLNSLYLWPLVLVLVLSAKKLSKFTFTKPNNHFVGSICVSWREWCMTGEGEIGPTELCRAFSVRSFTQWPPTVTWPVSTTQRKRGAAGASYSSFVHRCYNLCELCDFTIRDAILTCARKPT